VTTTELFEKVDEDPEVSGWGFELTLRLPRADTDTEPPRWALRLLDKLGQYVYSYESPSPRAIAWTRAARSPALRTPA
jgi:hypothetical protein